MYGLDTGGAAVWTQVKSLMEQYVAFLIGMNSTLNLLMCKPSFFLLIFVPKYIFWGRIRTNLISWGCGPWRGFDDRARVLIWTFQGWALCFIFSGSQNADINIHFLLEVNFSNISHICTKCRQRASLYIHILSWYELTADEEQLQDQHALGDRNTCTMWSRPGEHAAINPAFAQCLLR